jgi:chromosome segregation protein
MGNKQVHLRLDSQTKERYDSVLDKFKESDPNLTVNDVMSKFLDIVEVNIAKTSSLVSSKEMKELDYHANRMSKIYANIIQRAEELEAKDKTEIETLNNKIETDTKAFEEIMSAKNETIQNLEDEKLNLEDTLAEKEEHIKEISDHFDSNKDLIQNLEKQLIDYDETKNHNKSLTNELKELNRELANNKTELLEKNNMVDRQKIRIEMIKKNYEKSQSKIGLYKDNKKEQEETINNLKQEITDLKIKYNSISAKYDSTLKENVFYEKELEIIRSERSKNLDTTDK